MKNVKRNMRNIHNTKEYIRNQKLIHIHTNILIKEPLNYQYRIIQVVMKSRQPQKQKKATEENIINHNKYITIINTLI